MKKSEYEKQKKIWYKKLKNSGFVDIERDEKTFAIHHHDQAKDKNHASLVYRESKIEYYNMAASFLNDYEFKTKLDATIWDYHSNGISIDNITKILRKVRIKVSRYTVLIKITELRNLMFEKYNVK